MLDDNALARVRNGNFTAIAARTTVPSHRLVGVRGLYGPLTDTTLSRVPAVTKPEGDQVPWQHVAVLLVLTTIYAASYAFSLAIPDSTRDIYTAYRISVGEDFPLEGPVLGEAIHGGPAWFYLLAIPFIFHKSWLALALFVGVVAGLKFILAYVCGSRLVDPQFGLIWSLALVMPGWPTIQQVAFTNVNVVETCVLATLYFAIRVWERAATAWVFALGLACGLAFHAHPTTVPVVPLSLGVALLARPRHRRATIILVFSAACLAPFAPYLVSQVRNDFPDFRTGAAYVATSVDFRHVVNVFGIVRSVLFDGPLLIARDIIGVTPSLLPYAEAGLMVFVVAALIAAIRSAHASGRARMLWLTVGAVTIFAVAIACLRAATPAYFVYALTPSITALLALGVRAFIRNRLGSWMLYGSVAVVIFLQALVVERIAAQTNQGVGTLPGVGDLSAGLASEPSTNVWFPSLGHDDSGNVLCRYGDRVAVHGPMAFLVDVNVGVDTLLRCGRVPDVQLSGRGDADRMHWVGMPRLFWTKADLTPRCWIGSLGVATATSVIAPSASIARVSGKTFRPRPFVQAPSGERTLSFDTRGRQALVLTNVIHWYMPWQVRSVKVDGREIPPLVVTSVSRIYALVEAPGIELHRWEVQFAAPDIDKIDVVTIGASPRTVSDLPSCVDAG